VYTSINKSEMTTKYEDIGKEGNDLLSKSFPSNSGVKISFERNIPEGFELKANIDRQFKDNKEVVSIIFEPIFTFSQYKLKSKFLTRPEKEVSLEVKDLFTSGTLLEAGTNEKSQSYFGSVGFVNDNVNLNLKVNLPHDNEKPKADITVHANAVLNYPKDILWGVYGTAKKPTKEGSVVETGLNGRIHFNSSNTTIFFDRLVGSSVSHQLGLLWNQRVSNSVRVASKYTTSTLLSEAPTLEAVVEKKNEDGSIFKTKASVFKKEKVDHLDLKFLFSYTSKLSNHATYTLGADLNAREFFGPQGGDAVSVGFEVKLK